jgi:hypothetical protein
MPIVTDYAALSADQQRIIAANAASQGISPQDYLAQRGGLNTVTSLYGDFTTPYTLTDQQWLSTTAGLTGPARVTALQNANAKSQYDYLIAQGQSPDAASAASGWNGTSYVGTAATGGATASAASSSATSAITMANRDAAGKIIADRFAQYGLASLGTKIMDLARQGYTEATITLELQNSPEYQQRFAANAIRMKNGLAVLTPAEYIATEDSYRQTLRAYGLTQFDNDQYVQKFIANDMSAAELSSRVSTAVQRIQMAPAEVRNTLQSYYGISQSDMLSYVLDPAQALPKIQQQVTSAEIGAAAIHHGLSTGMATAEELAAKGITGAQAEQGYGTISSILPVATKLSEIYGSTLDTYGQTQAEQEVFGTLASAERKRKNLVAKEAASFSGSSGTGQVSLGQATNRGAF